MNHSIKARNRSEFVRHNLLNPQKIAKKKLTTVDDWISDLNNIYSDFYIANIGEVSCKISKEKSGCFEGIDSENLEYTFVLKLRRKF